MYKKALALTLTILVLLVSITACKSDVSLTNKESIDYQVNIIAENAKIWEPFDIYPGDRFKFSVTDLDANGRLEVITTVCRSTGLYSESTYYEVDETFTSLTKWEHKTDDFKEFLQADIVSSKTKCYINPNTSERFYIFGDHHKDTAAYTCNYKMCLTFKNKTVTEEMLAFWSISAATTDEAGNYDITETIQTRDGKALTIEEFSSLSENQFKGYKTFDTAIMWQDLSTDSDALATDLPKDELITLLTESYGGFTLTPELTQEELTSIENQINLMSTNQNFWLGSSEIQSNTNWEQSFCVTDLDNNGRIEVISASTMGSGISTNSKWAEVLADYESVLSSQNKMNPTGGPEIIVDSTDCYINPETNERFYSFTDTIRVSGDYSTHTIGILSYKNRTVNFTPLATCTSIAENPEDITVRTYTYKDSTGNTLTKEEFDSCVETYLKGYEKHTVTFKWQKHNKNAVPSQDEVIRLLTESYNGFNIK